MFFILLSFYVPWNLSQRRKFHWSGNRTFLFTIFFMFTIYYSLYLLFFHISGLFFFFFRTTRTKTKMWKTKFKTHYFRERSSMPRQLHSQFFRRVTWKECNTAHWVHNTIFIHFTQVCRQHTAASRAELGLHCYWVTWLRTAKRFLRVAPINANENVTK